MKLTDKLKYMKEPEDIQHTGKASTSRIHGNIKSMLRMPWLSQPDELSAHYVKIPEVLLLFLNALYHVDLFSMTTFCLYFAGGTKGFSLNPGAVSRCYIITEYHSCCLKQLRKLTEVSESTLIHHDLTVSRIRYDPFRDVPSKLISKPTETMNRIGDK